MAGPTDPNGADRYFALRSHLASEHQDTLAYSRTDQDALDAHEDDHRGPGSIRNHDPKVYTYDSREIQKLFAEEAAAQAEDAGPITVAGATLDFLAVAAGRQMKMLATDGREVTLRLATPEELLAQRAAAARRINRPDLPEWSIEQAAALVKAADLGGRPGYDIKWPDPDARPSY